MMISEIYPTDQAQCVHAARCGSLTAFNDLVLANQDAAYRLAYYLLGDRAAAEDITQQAFLASYQKLETFRGGSFRGWLLRIVRNAAYDELRRRKRRQTISLDPMEDEEDSNRPPLERLPDGGAGPEEMVETREQQRVVRAAIARLPEEFRAVVVLVDLEGMDYQEAAEAIGTPVGTVKSRLARARMRLHSALATAAM